MASLAGHLARLEVSEAVDPRTNVSAVYEVTHSGAWLPREAWEDRKAWDRLIDWIKHRCSDTFDLRLIITPTSKDSIDAPEGLRKLGHDALRQDMRSARRGQGGLRADGPVIIVWPQESTVKEWVLAVAGLSQDTIVLIEQQVSDSRFPSFQGWATAVGAFNAATGRDEQCDPQLEDELDDIFTSYENELALPPSAKGYPTSAPILRAKLEALSARGYEEDFIVTYAIALGYAGDLGRLRRHYSRVRQD